MDIKRNAENDLKGLPGVFSKALKKTIAALVHLREITLGMILRII